MKTPPFVLLLAAPLLLATAGLCRQAPLSQLPEDEVKPVSAAAEAAVKGAARQDGLKFQPDATKAVAYRIGAGAVWFVPDRGITSGTPSAEPVQGGTLMSLALVVTRGVTLGDYRTMVAPERTLSLKVGTGPEKLSLFPIALRQTPQGTRLEIQSVVGETLASVPMRAGAMARSPLTLRLLTPEYAEMTLDAAGWTAAVRVGPPRRQPEEPAGAPVPQ